MGVWVTNGSVYCASTTPSPVSGPDTSPSAMIVDRLPSRAPRRLSARPWLLNAPLRRCLGLHANPLGGSLGAPHLVGHHRDALIEHHHSLHAGHRLDLCAVGEPGHPAARDGGRRHGGVPHARHRPRRCRRRACRTPSRAGRSGPRAVPMNLVLGPGLVHRRPREGNSEAASFGDLHHRITDLTGGLVDRPALSRVTTSETGTPKAASPTSRRAACEPLAAARRNAVSSR